MNSKPHRGNGIPRVAKRFASLSDGDPNAEVVMFVEDVQLGIMPIDNAASGFSVQLDGRPEQVQGAVAILESLCPGEYEGMSLKELVSTVVVHVAESLAWDGRAVYEIDRIGRQGYGLLPEFTSRRLFRAFGQYIQVVPRADRVMWKRAFFRIAARDVWDVRMPRELGGARGYRTMLNRLGQFGHLSPSFLLRKSKDGSWPKHYDFLRYVGETEFFVSLTTSRWGWNRREYSERNGTEFYLLYRSLRFRWAQVVLREHIVGEINRLFPRLQVEAKIRMSGLPTAAEILGIRDQMQAGQISLESAVRAYAG